MDFERKKKYLYYSIMIASQSNGKFIKQNHLLLTRKILMLKGILSMKYK